MRKTKAMYNQYVCPNCFNKIYQCTCNFLPQSLIQIDEGMQENIRILNAKGYVTTGCCESHYTKDGRPSMYICFAKPYEAVIETELPRNFSYDIKKHGIVRVWPKGLSRSEFEAQKAPSLFYLRKWCDQLPNLRKQDIEKKLAK